MYVPRSSPKYLCEKCRNKIPIDDLDAIFEEQLKNFTVSPVELGAHMEKGKHSLQEKELLVEKLNKEHRKVAGEVERLHELYQAGEIDKKGFGQRYKQLSERRDQLENEIPQVEAERDVLKISIYSQEEVYSGAKDLFQRWGSLGLDERRQIIETVVSRITAHEEEVEIQLAYRPAANTK
jgi:site-specific DNA recombinase